jgi:Uma2 family endonuclease
MGAKENSFANDLLMILGVHLQSHPVGRAFLEMLFRLDRAGRLERRPDLAVVLYERWPDRIIPDTEAWEMIPALAVEVVSKSNTAIEILDQIYDYFEHGVSLVWVIYLKRRVIHVYESPKSIRVLDATDTLDGGKVLPDFHLPLADLFDPHTSRA